MSFLFNFNLRNIVHHHAKVIVPLQKISVTQVKTLYSPLALGIDNYLQSRKKTNDRFLNYSDKFRSKMESFIADDKSMIFTEDLKNMVHMAEVCDLDLILKMIKKFNSNSEVRFGSFVFGPVVMRMFHFLDAPKEALQCFNDPANVNFFNQQISYQILLDLLYNNQMYDDMYKVFDIIREKQLNMTKFPKYSVVLIFAACYKQNTPESLQYASKIRNEMNEVGVTPLRRASTFFAGLALRQGAPHIALEAISTQKQHYVTIRNIKAVAMAEMGRVDDALVVLRSVVVNDVPTQNLKHTFFEETITKVKAAVEKSNDDIKKEFENILEELTNRSLIDNESLESHLNSEIKIQQDQQRISTDRRMRFDHRKRIM